MSEYQEKIHFLQKHAGEFAPVVEDRELLNLLETKESSLGIPPERLEKTLEQAETKVFVREKPEGSYQPGARRVLASASESLAYQTMKPIIDRLSSDSRCSGVELLTDNVAGTLFEKELKDFERIRDKNAPVLLDAMEATKKKPFDVALVPVDPVNSPNSATLYGGKSIFGAKKLYFIATGWVGIGSTNLFKGEQAKQMDSIDGVFCNDELAKRIILHQLPEYPAERILTTGTPVVDALERHKATEYTEAGREKLRLDNDTLAILYVGDVSPGRGTVVDTDLNPRYNEATFEQTLQALEEVAKAKPDQKFALLVRPHPRDPNSQELFDIASRQLPDNLTIRPATKNDISLQEASYAADAVTSIASTENFLAPLRGKPAIFLGYDQLGMGLNTLRKLYGDEIIKIIGQQEMITVAKSPEEFASAAVSLRRPTLAHSGENIALTDSVSRILDHTLAE